MKKYASLTVCAWCGKTLATTKSEEPGRISHGICPKCRKRYFPEYEKEVKK